MEWEAPAIVLDIRPYGEGDVVATVMTEAHGRHRGLARGGASRGKAALWQVGNLLQLRWTARLADQLGSFSGEMIHPTAALSMAEALPLSMLTAICAIAAGALPEHEAHPGIFAATLQLLPRLPLGPPTLTRLVQWEVQLLAELGYGLDLSVCAVTRRQEGLAFVSPRTGRAVTQEGAGTWSDRLLPLPAFLLPDFGQNTPHPAEDWSTWRDGLRLTGHFLERDAFGPHHRPLPFARLMLYDRVSAQADRSSGDGTADGG